MSYRNFNNNTTAVKEVSLYCKPNPYGYKLNVNHPYIYELYERYRAWKGIARNFPISDMQRIEFENYLFRCGKVSPP